MLERDLDTRRQVRSALLYPACVVAVLAAASIFLVGFVVPGFVAMFEQRGQEVPAFTAALGAIGRSVQHAWWAYTAGLAGLIAAAGAARHKPAFAGAVEAALHRIPFLRDILAGLAVARFTRILGLCLDAGIGLIGALEMAAGASGRPALRRDIDRLVAEVRRGGRLAAGLSRCPYIPAFTRRMLAAGEESSELPRMCAVAARHHERETTALTANICTVIEPVLVVMIALVVLAVALAIFQPMWDMVKIVG
jgi:type II secretory pathway component PulF